MKQSTVLKFLSIALVWTTPLFAQQEETIRLSDVSVTADPGAPDATVLSGDELLSTLKYNAGELIADLPGMSAVKRGACAAEPVIRGLGWERVVTQVDGVPVYGACPSRMDPPASYVSTHSAEEVIVIKGLPSVTLGPGGTAGRVVVKSDYDRADNPEPGFDTTIGSTWDDSRDGYTAYAKGQGGTSNLDVRAVVDTIDLDDYESADSVRVPAEQRENGGAVALGWRPAEGQRVWGSAKLRRIDAAEYPSLPMDTIRSEANLFSGGVRIRPEADAVERLELTAGFADVEHLMSNINKPNRRMLQASTPATSESLSASAAVDWVVSEPSMLTLGVDYSGLERDATRTRFIVATGQTFQDHLWPDAEQEDVGAYAEWGVTLSDRLWLRLGGRVDYVTSDAKGATEKIRAAYVKYSGPEAADVDQDETLGAGNIRAEYTLTDDVTVYASGGLVSRTANVTERYFAFGPAPGGFQVGNPALDPEMKFEIDAGVTRRGEDWDGSISVFAATVNDYIYQSQIDRLDVNGDGVEDVLRGFRNVDAELVGGEVSARWRPCEGVTIPVALSYVDGRNTTDDRDLPEIPPLIAQIATRYDQAGWWCELGARLAARQDQVDETFPEDETPSYQVVHLRGGATLHERVDLEVGIENLFDEEYHQHLTREALLPVGDLKGGDEIPEPGRFVYVSVSCKL